MKTIPVTSDDKSVGVTSEQRSIELHFKQVASGYARITTCDYEVPRVKGLRIHLPGMRAERTEYALICNDSHGGLVHVLSRGGDGYSLIVDNMTDYARVVCVQYCVPH